jgi:hypothetical protein
MKIKSKHKPGLGTRAQQVIGASYARGSAKIGTHVIIPPAPQISDANRRLVEMATVRLPENGGCGVLVGEFILTATHCIEWSGTGGMALGDVYLNAVETASGAKFHVGVAACEPVSDIAALGELDIQEFNDDVQAFEEWREEVEPVPLSTMHIKVGPRYSAFIYNHKREWMAASVIRYGRDMPRASVGLIADGIESGTSGSPVVTASGRLLGVVSWSSGLPDSSIPLAHMALPQWVLARIGEFKPPSPEERAAALREREMVAALRKKADAEFNKQQQRKRRTQCQRS